MAMKGNSAFPKASPPDCLVSNPGHLLRRSYASAEIQLVYSTTPTEWANTEILLKHIKWTLLRNELYQKKRDFLVK